METDPLNEVYEEWRGARSRVEPSPGFADGVMRRLGGTRLPSAGSQPAPRFGIALRALACAAAVLAALFRIVELIGVFRTTGIEN